MYTPEEVVLEKQQPPIERVRTLVGSRAPAAGLFPSINPEGWNAHAAIRVALKGGRIKKLSECEHCGSNNNVKAHHPNYNYPLFVVWLCCKCHMGIHIGKFMTREMSSSDVCLPEIFEENCDIKTEYSETEYIIYNENSIKTKCMV